MSDFGDFITTGDHARGCAGREYACTCGYDDAKDAEILRLRAELAALREPAGDLVEVAARAIRTARFRALPDADTARAVLDAVLPRVRAEEREDGGVSESADIRLALQQTAEDGSRTDTERNLARRALNEIRRLTPDAAP